MKIHILVVRDQPVGIDILSKFLKHKGYQITLAGSQDTMRISTNSNPDLILIDEWLSEIETLELIRQIRTELTNIPIIVLISPYMMNTDLTQLCLEAGANDYITKPFSEQLETTILTYIDCNKGKNTAQNDY